MFKVTIPIKLKVKGPFVSQSTEPGIYGYDAVQALDSKGRPIIPGSQVAGKLRQAWQELNSALSQAGATPGKSCPVPKGDEIHRLLGKAAGNELEPYRKRLFFSDFVLKDRADSRVKFRIKIDPERQAVESQALASIQVAVPPGQDALFHGQVTFLARDEAEAEKIKAWITTGLRFVEHFGAFHSIGFGRVEEVAVCGEEKIPIRLEDAEMSQGKKASPGSTPLELAIRPLSPFCIARRHKVENVFESLEFIPGNVILGTLKTTLDQLSSSDFKKLGENFDNIRILHAFPGDQCLKRPVTPPLSAVKVGKEIFDVALLEGPCLIDGKAQAFSIDWKDPSDVWKMFGWPGLERELRIRTAIDPETGRSAENRLFSYEMIVPDGKCWLTKVFFNHIEDENERKAVIEQFKALVRAGLMGFGKAKTLAEITVLPEGTIEEPEEANTISPYYCTNREMVITLNTPALLLSPGLALNEDAGKEQLFEAYSQVWDELSQKKLKLKRFFARQGLSGGEYQSRRFQKEAMDFCYPWILTEAGSVFVFDMVEGCNNEIARSWLEKGLPLPENVCKFYGISHKKEEQWQACPFISQNGYGEIVLNLEFHWTRMPQNQSIKYIGQ